MEPSSNAASQACSRKVRGVRVISQTSIVEVSGGRGSDKSTINKDKLEGRAGLCGERKSPLCSAVLYRCDSDRRFIGWSLLHGFRP